MRVSGPNARDARRLTRALGARARAVGDDGRASSSARASTASMVSSARASTRTVRENGGWGGFTANVLRLVEFAREDAETTEPPIDVGFAVVFDAPRSFTGEDVVEFHTHGSLAVQRAVMDALGELDCFRVAEAGEFS